MFDNSNKELFKSDTNGDCLDDDDSAYTTADNFDPDKLLCSDKSTEPIRPGDVILYYCPIFVTGNPRGLQETTILAVNPNGNNPLGLSNGDGIPNTTHVKRIKVFCNNILMEHSGIFCEIRRYVLKKAGTATAADGVYMNGRKFDVIMKKHLKNAMLKSNCKGFAPADILIDKFNDSKTGKETPIINTIPMVSRKLFLSQDTIRTENIKVGTHKYVFTHKSETEALLILRWFGTVQNVPGDGS